jgi:hypothetical protein
VRSELPKKVALALGPAFNAPVSEMGICFHTFRPTPGHSLRRRIVRRYSAGHVHDPPVPNASNALTNDSGEQLFAFADASAVLKKTMSATFVAAADVPGGVAACLACSADSRFAR